MSAIGETELTHPAFCDMTGDCDCGCGGSIVLSFFYRFPAGYDNQSGDLYGNTALLASLRGSIGRLYDTVSISADRRQQRLLMSCQNRTRLRSRILCNYT
jgi:hypothetical protein